MDPVVTALVEQHGVSVGLDVAASIAGFSEDKVRQLRRAGRFPGHRAGTKVIVFLPELVDWMRNGGAVRTNARIRRAATSRRAARHGPPRLDGSSLAPLSCVGEAQSERRRCRITQLGDV
jgi:hypothetical protein